MNRFVLLAAAAVLAVAVIAVAVVATSGDDDAVNGGATAPTATATQDPDSPISATPAPTLQPGQPTPVPPTAVPPATLPAGRHAEPAPIDGVDVLSLDSFPPQYVVNIQAGLPSGCAERYRHDVTRSGNVIDIVVLNSQPDGSPACTLIYGMYQLNINLGSDFTPGQTYTVRVNDQQITFAAQ